MERKNCDPFDLRERVVNLPALVLLRAESAATEVNHEECSCKRKSEMVMFHGSVTMGSARDFSTPVVLIGLRGRKLYRIRKL